MKNLFYILAITLLILGCAKRGTPSGGPKDELPPEILKSTPENYSSNFTSKEIKLTFNEYVKLKDLSKQLIISPPLKYQPTIYPQGGASKQIKIKILDTLQENTTYSINFGNSIVDNNEENPLQFYRYVFSTGESIDSLTLSGSVKDALSSKTDDYVSVLLYEIDSIYTDSTIYKDKPRYVTNTLDSATTFKFENLKEGKYKLIALKEESNNYLFNQEVDKIGFVEQEVVLPTTEEFDLVLFNEVVNYRSLKPKHERKTRIKFRYEGPYKFDIKITNISKNLPSEFESIITKEIESDTLNLWFKPELDLDSLNFIQSYKEEIDSFRVKMRKKVKNDSLSFNKLTNFLELDKDFEISSSIPISKINKEKIKLIDKDSNLVDFNIVKDELTNKLSFVFDKEEKQNYNITALPESFTDFYGNVNDTLVFKPTTKALSKYGTMMLTITNAPKSPIIVQLVTDKGDVKYEQFGNNESKFDFKFLNPGKYQLRVIFDDNNNQQYNTGNYLNNIQPERVSYYPEEIEIRANWDRDYKFTLK